MRYLREGKKKCFHHECYESYYYDRMLRPSEGFFIYIYFAMITCSAVQW